MQQNDFRKRSNVLRIVIELVFLKIPLHIVTATSSGFFWGGKYVVTIDPTPIGRIGRLLVDGQDV